jgi:hypothetical protein
VKLRRVVVFSLGALLLATGLWVVGGNAWAARREQQRDRAWTAAFGSLDDLKKKYPAREMNETAKQLVELTRGTVFDLTPVVGYLEPEEMRLGTEWKRSQGMFEFLMAQVAKPEASIDPPSEEAIRFLEEKSLNLDAIESILAAGPPPEWALDLSVPENDLRRPNVLGHIRVQRALIARALAAAHDGHNEVSARSLEASWHLNEFFRGRPEVYSTRLSMAIARLQVGTLRKVNVEEDLWRKRLATLDPRISLLDYFAVEIPAKSHRWSLLKKDGDRSWFQPAWDFLGRPWHRMQMADYSDLVRVELVSLRSAPLSDRAPEPTNPTAESANPKGWGLAHTLASIAIPNIRDSFARADRLVVDAELTSKILEAKHLRRENGGRWPAAIPGIEASRYPEASWRYEASPDGGRMSIAFSRELAFPEGLKPLPLRFSSN